MAVITSAGHTIIELVDNSNPGVINSSTQYAVNISESIAPSSGWQTTPPAQHSGEYLWSQTTLTMDDGTTGTVTQVVETPPVQFIQASTATEAQSLSAANPNSIYYATNIVGLIDLFYPVGSLYFSTSAANPGVRWPGTTWVAWGGGRVPVGIGSNGTTNYTTVEATGGAETVTLTAAQSGNQAQTATVRGSRTNPGDHGFGHVKYASGDPVTWLKSDGTLAAGGDVINFAVQIPTINNNANQIAGIVANIQAKNAASGHENRMPYITCYIWKRTQ